MVSQREHDLLINWKIFSLFCGFYLVFEVLYKTVFFPLAEAAPKIETAPLIQTDRTAFL